MFETFDETDTNNLAVCESLIVIPKTDCYETYVNGSEDMVYYFSQKELYHIIHSRFPEVNIVDFFANTYLETPILIDHTGTKRANLKFDKIDVNITLDDLGFFQ